MLSGGWKWGGRGDGLVGGKSNSYFLVFLLAQKTNAWCLFFSKPFNQNHNDATTSIVKQRDGHLNTEEHTHGRIDEAHIWSETAKEALSTRSSLYNA